MKDILSFNKTHKNSYCMIGIEFYAKFWACYYASTTKAIFTKPGAVHAGACALCTAPGLAKIASVDQE